MENIPVEDILHYCPCDDAPGKKPGNCPAGQCRIGDGGIQEIPDDGQVQKQRHTEMDFREKLHPAVLEHADALVFVGNV